MTVDASTGGAGIGGIVLAAGAGTRFGQAKARVVFEGELLVDRAVRTLAAAGCAPVIVVLGADAAEVTARAALSGAVVTCNEAWEGGLATSFTHGLAQLRDTSAGAAVILLVDQPLVTPAAVSRLIAPWRDGARAVTATFSGTARPPVLLDRSVWDAAGAQAAGDGGARIWLDAHPDLVVKVACDDVAAADDIDSPADLARLQEHVRR